LPSTCEGSPSLYRSGAATSPALYVWNGAISPDRVVNSAGTAFGQDMVMGFSTSSAQDFAAAQMVSKVGDQPQSRFVLVKQSPGPDIDFTCLQTCRWGDYSGATSDPAASLSGTRGRVWLTNEWNVASATDKDVDARTWIWSAVP
jgi:hypothetical protein